MLNSAQRPNLTVTPSPTCSFAANYHLNFPQPAPIWPCSSVGRATVICSWGRGFESQRGQRFFSLSPCGPIFFLGLSLRRYYLGYLLEHFNLPYLNHFIKYSPMVIRFQAIWLVRWSTVISSYSSDWLYMKNAWLWGCHVTFDSTKTEVIFESAASSDTIYFQINICRWKIICCCI